MKTINFPAFVGDTIYHLYGGYFSTKVNGPKKDSILWIEVLAGNHMLFHCLNVVVSLSDFNKTWFLTKEDAEKGISYEND